MAKKQPAYEAAAPATDKKKALETAMAQIKKNFGAGSIMRLGDAASMNVEVIPTGSLTLDLALGVGGLPKGRIVEIYGPESSGKTTLALHIVAEAQNRGGEVAFIDAEHALDPGYARALGVDIDSMLISQPDTGEQGLEICEALVRSGAIDVVVVDSVAALTPRAEIEGDMGDSHVGLLARLMSQALRKLAGSISKTNCIVIFINQLREKVGVMYGNPEVTTGGRALKFYSSVRIDVRRVEALKNGSEIIGNRTRAKIVKNKVAPPFREAEFDILYGEGISKWGELVDLAVKLDIVQKSGSWFAMGELRLGQGRDAVKQYLQDHPELAEDIEAQVKPSKRVQGRWLAVLEDGSILRLGENEIIDFALCAGKELTEEEAEGLMASLHRSGLKEKALSLLARKPQSRKELERKLSQWEATQEEAAAICERMAELGYLDDAAYAAQVVRYYSAKGYGERKLRDELYCRGVPRELWEDALDQAQDSSTAIDAFLTKKLGGRTPDRQELKKLSDALARRGYHRSEINEALGRCGAEVELD